MNNDKQRKDTIHTLKKVKDLVFQVVIHAMAKIKQRQEGWLGVASSIEWLGYQNSRPQFPYL